MPRSFPSQPRPAPGSYCALSTEDSNCSISPSTLSVPWAAEQAEEDATKQVLRYTHEQRSVISHLTRALAAMSQRVDNCRQENHHLQRQLRVLRETNAVVADEDVIQTATYNSPVTNSPLISPLMSRHASPRLSLDGDSDGDSLEVESISSCSSTDVSSDSSISSPTRKTNDANQFPAKIYRQSTSQRKPSDAESRKANLLFYGIDEEDDEGRCDCFFKVRDFLWYQLGVGDNRGGKIVCIQFAHRLGDQKHRGKPRPILVKFADLKQRAEILRRARQMLRGSRVRITEEYSATTQEVCKQLVKYLNFRRTRQEVTSTESMIHLGSLSSDSEDERETFI